MANSRLGGSLCVVVANVLDCNIVVSEFDLKFTYRLIP